MESGKLKEELKPEVVKDAVSKSLADSKEKINDAFKAKK